MFQYSRLTISQPVTQQIRNASSSGRKKTRITSFRTDLRKFLGPKNFKGMYTKNPFFWAAKKHEPQYMSHYSLRGTVKGRSRSTDWQKAFSKKVSNGLQPFTENQFCKSNSLVSREMKDKILQSYYQKKVSVQRIGFTFGLSIPRVEAIIALDKVERQTKKQMPAAVGKLANTMEQMFPVLTGRSGNDDLTEIPIPKETRHQRFLAVAESEPFGPVDAATVLDIEPASQTLEKLNNHEMPNTKQTSTKQLSFVAPQLEGEQSLFKFTNAKAGSIGYRYGASRDDKKHARKITFTATGQKVYA